MSLPDFPVDTQTLDLLDVALHPGAEAERTSVTDLCRMFAEMGGGDPDECYHQNDILAALLAEVRRLRAACPRPHIVIDPAKCFGSPHIKGISADAIASLVRAGESFATVGHEFELTRHEVVLACWWEGLGGRYRPVWRWWAQEAAQVLAQERPRVDMIDEPPSVEKPGG